MSESGRVGKSRSELTDKRTAKSGYARSERIAAWLPRAMRAEQGAAYLSMSKSMFLLLVEEGDLPQPVRPRNPLIMICTSRCGLFPLRQEWGWSMIGNRKKFQNHNR